MLSKRTPSVSALFKPATFHESEPQSAMTLTVVEMALRAAPLAADAVVVDAWCRTGKLARTLAHKVPNGKIFCYDPSEEMISFANESAKPQKNISYLQRDMLHPDPQADIQQADLLISAWHLPLLQPDQAVPYAQELFRHLKQNGRLILTFPVGESDLAEAIKKTMDSDKWNACFAEVNLQRYTPAPEEIASLLQHAGFENIEPSTRISKHNFSSKSALKKFIETALSRQLPHVPEESHQKFIDDVCENYLAVVEHTEHKIPYAANLFVGIASKPVLELRSGNSLRK